MQVFTSVSASIDQTVIEAFEEQPGLPARIRLQPQVMRRPDGLGRTYMVWRDLHWTIEVDTLEEAQDFRVAMTRFFDIIRRDGVSALKKQLEQPAA